MQVQGVGQGVIAGATAPDEAPLGLGQGAFLKLLLAQLRQQDPLDPLDNQEFVAQLATFNSLDQLVGINSKLEGLQADQAMLGRIEATSMIGREVVSGGDQVALRRGEEATLHYALARDAVRVVVNITDGSGELVRVLDLGGQGAGDQTAPWDGKDGLGQELEPGIYTFEVNAFDAAGQQVQAATKVRGRVSGVNVEGGEPVLDLGGLAVPLSAVIAVSEAERS